MSDTLDPQRVVVAGLRAGLPTYDAAIVSAMATLRSALVDRAAAVAAIASAEAFLPNDHYEPIRPVSAVLAAESKSYYDAAAYDSRGQKSAVFLPVEFAVPSGAER